VQYMLLIYDDEKAWAARSDDDRGETTREYFSLTEELNRAGAFISGSALEPTESATTISVRNGDRLTTDGPFAETKEQLGGYYLIEAPSLDEALEWAAKIPSAQTGRIEVRPLREIPEPPQ
jgi:hypothetical protein